MPVIDRTCWNCNAKIDENGELNNQELKKKCCENPHLVVHSLGWGSEKVSISCWNCNSLISESGEATPCPVLPSMQSFVSQESPSKELDAHKRGDLRDKLLPCPFCGEKAVIENEGTQADITCEGCYASNNIQISDYFTREERYNDPDFAWQDAPIYGYATKGKQRAVDVLTKLWNTRSPSKQLDMANRWRRESEARQYELAQELEAQTERLATLDSEKAMNAELTEQLTTTQQALDTAVEALKDFKSDIEVQALDMGDFTWIPTVEYEQAIERLEAALTSMNGK